MYKLKQLCTAVHQHQEQVCISSKINPSAEVFLRISKKISEVLWNDFDGYLLRCSLYSPLDYTPPSLEKETSLLEILTYPGPILRKNSMFKLLSCFTNDGFTSCFTRFGVFIVCIDFTHYPSVSKVDFEKVNSSWVNLGLVFSIFH